MARQRWAASPRSAEETNTSVLSIRQLSSVVRGIQPVDLELGAGECVAIFGASGSGKSVLLRRVADLDPGSGEVLLHGRDCKTFTAPQWRSHVVYQAAEPAWWARTAREHFQPASMIDAAALCIAVGLSTDILDGDIARLSTGERQRLALIRTLIAKPKVALLDEPTASLDAECTTAVEQLLQERLSAGLAIIFVTHSKEQAARLAHRIFMIDDHALKPAPLA